MASRGSKHSSSRGPVKPTSFRIPKLDAPESVGVVGMVEGPPPTPGGIAGPPTPTPSAAPVAPPAPTPPVAPPPTPAAEEAPPLATLSGATPEIQNEDADPPVGSGRALKRYRVTKGHFIFWRSQRLNMNKGKMFREMAFSRQALKAFTAAGIEWEEV